LLLTRKQLNQGFLLVKLKSWLRRFYGRHLGWPLWNICVTNDHGYVPLVVNTSRSFPRSWLITGFVTRLTWRVSLVEQELPTLPVHLSSPPVFSGVRVTRSLVLYVCFVDSCLSFCTFSLGHCVVCSSSIYGFWLPLWYLQTLLELINNEKWILFRCNSDGIQWNTGICKYQRNGAFIAVLKVFRCQRQYCWKYLILQISLYFSLFLHYSEK
jgi:hypothetical protein